MNHAVEKSFGEKEDICDVCEIPLEGLKVVSREFDGKVLTFCSQEHLKEYMEDPEKYAEFQDDEAKE